MSYGKSSLLRKLIPKSYHFDGYNETKCPNTRDKPFFAEGVAKLGDYYLNKRIDNSGNLILEYSSVCPNGHISFKPYILSFESFIELLRTAIDEESDFITFQIQTTYKPCSDTKCLDKNTHCSHLLKDKPHTLMAAVSFEVTDIKNALSVYFGINKPKSFIKGGNTIMANKNFLGMNFEFGISKDRNIASTLLGLAVKNQTSGDWYVYDSANRVRKNISPFKNGMGNFPILLIPVRELPIGSTTKLDGKYYYVESVNDNSIKLIDAENGIICEKIKGECIIPGMNLYTQVVAIDAKTLSEPNSKNNLTGNILAAMCMMNWAQGGKSEFSLDDINDESFNGLGSLWPMLMASGAINGNGGLFGNDNFSLPLLMMMGGDNSENNGGMQFLALNYLLGGGNGNNSMFGAIPGISPTATVGGVANTGEVYCPECKTTYPVGTNFCSHCGTQTVSAASNVGEVYCPVCNVTYPAGTNFCSKCGSATQVKGKVCAKCGTTLNDGAAFCHNCGQKVVNDVCPECGEKVTEGAKFCSKCGTSLTPAPKKTAIPKTAPKKGASPRKKAAPKPETVSKDSDM